MGKLFDMFMVAAIVSILVLGLGVVLIPGPKYPEIRYTITATGNVEDVAFGSPERGFWGEESGAIDWEQMPLNYTHIIYDEEDIGIYIREYWFRERWFNGTEWIYNNHGPFFVEFPQYSYYREIVLNNHTVYVEMELIN
jgi:hypothetical protein